MKTTKTTPNNSINRFHVGSWIVWTLLVAFLVVINIKQQRAHSLHLAINTAQSSLAKDKSLRLWGTSHGGVYVPPSDRTPPNPDLKHIPDRDIVTSKGKKLTLMNPAYMVSQMMHEYVGLYGARGHITSLKSPQPQKRS